MDDTELGSWARAVTVADGFWQIPGFHSPNGSGVICNYMTGALLAYGHQCMRGDNPYGLERVCCCEERCSPFELVCDGELKVKGSFAGTSKAMESIILFDAFARLFDKGCHVAKNIEDGDGGSDKSFSLVYSGSDSASYLCGNHGARSCCKRVVATASTKSWKTTKEEEKSGQLPVTHGLKCWCTGNHTQGCGCVKGDIAARLRLNLTLAMMNAGTDPDKFIAIMEQIIQHTCGTACPTPCFHPARVCCCEKQCDPHGEMACAGKPYEVGYRVRCPYHAAAVERVLRDFMKKAKKLIDEELGRIVSNLPEKFAWVVKGFRNKEHVLQSLHYILKTNMGLLQGNQNAMCARVGSMWGRETGGEGWGGEGVLTT